MREPLPLVNLAVLAAEERHEQGGQQQAPASILERQRNAPSREAADQEHGRHGKRDGRKRDAEDEIDRPLDIVGVAGSQRSLPPAKR